MKTHAVNPRRLFLAALLIMSAWPGTAFAEEEDAAVQQAAEHHERGTQLFREGNHRGAAREFERAEQLAHSRANVMNLARCYQELGENEQALQYIESYLQEPDLPQDARDRAEQMRQQLLPSGSEGGGGRSLAGPWALLGSGLALLVTGGVLDIVAYSRSGDHDFTNVSEYRDWRDGAVNLAIAGDVLVAVGAAAAVGGLIWLLVVRSRVGGNARSRGASVALSPGPGGGLFVHTQFGF